MRMAVRRKIRSPRAAAAPQGRSRRRGRLSGAQLGGMMPTLRPDTASPTAAPSASGQRRRLRRLAAHLPHGGAGCPAAAVSPRPVAAQPGAAAALVSASDIVAFEQNGFLRIGGAFSAAEMNRIEDELARYISEEMPSQSGEYPAHQQSTDESSEEERLTHGVE